MCIIATLFAIFVVLITIMSTILSEFVREISSNGYCILEI